MINRWLLFFVCICVGPLLLLAGLDVPSHLRATDSRVLELARRKSPALIDTGLTFAREKRLEVAQLFLLAAQAADLPGQDKLRTAVDNRNKNLPDSVTTPFTEFIIRTENRDVALAQLNNSANTGVQELLLTRALTNTTLLPPSSASAGQTFDATVALCGLLIDAGQLNPDLTKAIFAQASEANHGNGSEPFEQDLMDFMSLGQRFNREQLVEFLNHVTDPAELHALTGLVREHEKDLPVLFAAVELSGSPSLVTHYLASYSEFGMADLQASLRFGAGGVREFLRRHQRLYLSDRQAPVVLELSLKNPGLALMLKWGLYLLSGFLIALAVHFIRPAVLGQQWLEQVRGIHVARESLFALGFLLVALLLSEPFLAQDTQKAEPGFHLRLSTMGSVVTTGTGGKPHTSFMNQLSLLTLVLFFVLQGLLYVASLVKLAEINRQSVPARIKLKLLENEDHLFDAGLYLGFVGTIISLILVSLGVIKPSLMAAYSSTSFGIIFVSVFKIFKLRPLRGKLLMEAEYPASTNPASPTAPL